MACPGGVGTGRVLPALKTSIDGLSQSDLRSVIPQIIRSTTGVRPHYGNSSQKPKWWPYDLPYCNPHDDFRDPSCRKQKPWSEVLRDIIKNCYQYYGQEHLLSGADTAHGSPSIKVVNNQDGSVSFITQSAVVTLEDRQNTPYAACPPTMEATTPGRSLSASTGAPDPLPTGLFMSAQQPGSRNSSKPVQTATPQSKPFVEVFMCFFCEKEFHHKQALQQHQDDCEMWPAHFSRTTSTIRTRSKPEQIHVVPRKPRKLVEDKVIFPPKSTYIESLDLLPQAKAESVRRESHSRVVDCDVLVLDESKPPKTPTTPRTPKSLISQLSRDMSPPARVRLKIGDEGAVNSVDDSSDNESESGKSEGEGHYRPRRAAALLTIDISSLLGERVRKHISTYFANLEQYQTSPEACSKDYENFCKTPTKNKVTERLRSRGKDIQVTFRKTKRTAPAHCHKYKFRHSDRAEFCRIVETGLNRRGRALKRKVKKCRVVLDRLPESVIKKWTRNRRGHSSQRYNQFNIGGTGFNLLPLSTQSSVNTQQLRTILSLSEVARDQLLAQLAQGVSLEVVYQWMLSGLGQPVLSSSPADLTPPSTPEELTNMGDDDVICLDDSGPWGTTPPNSGLAGGAPIHGQSSSVVQRKVRLSTEHQLRNAMLDISSEDPHLDDDVISISSEESAELVVVSPESLKRKRQWSPSTSDLPAKRRRVDQLRPSALLFKCHLCSEELTCHENANRYIKGHFARSHNVYNIDLIEHFDPNGQKVVSIVEVPTPENHPQSSFYLSTDAPPVTPVHVYQNVNSEMPQSRGVTNTSAKHKPAILQSKKNSKTASPVLPPSTKHTSASAVLTAKQTKTAANNSTAQKPSKTVSSASAPADKQKPVGRTNKPGPSSSKNRPQIKIALKVTRSNTRNVKTK